ncbi:MAG: hypothetical protein Q8M94_14250, partial [Ignavibacteria bacterium]|nr:hypothetical protein [Ignavibacteria bacterium]
MKNYVFAILLSTFVLFAGSSCDDNNTNPDEKYYFKYYPLKEGNWWLYQTIDSSNSNSAKFDTILLKVISTDYTPGIDQNTCNWYKNDSIISVMKVYANDNVIMFEQGFGNLEFYIPFNINDEWEDWRDYRIQVNSYIKNMDVVGKNYNAFSIMYSGGVPNSGWRYNYFLADSIGIIKLV